MATVIGTSRPSIVSMAWAGLQKEQAPEVRAARKAAPPEKVAAAKQALAAAEKKAAPKAAKRPPTKPAKPARAKSGTNPKGKNER